MLRGDRVVLRPIEQGDLPRLWELLRDFEVSVLSSNGPVGPQSLAEFQTQHEERGAEAKRRAFYFAIDVNGELVGQCGLHAIDHFNRRCDVGIEIGRDFWGKGFGQDAVRTLVHYAFEHLNMNRGSSCTSSRTTHAPSGPTGRRDSSRRGGCAGTRGCTASTTMRS
jgi:RimJ/RimL family protein N-acetyltransferase